jgi:radical SAM protein (TIGR01212 family)
MVLKDMVVVLTALLAVVLLVAIKDKSLIEQFYDIKKVEDQKWPNAKYIAYFQANTNTYAPTDYLKSIYEPFLTIKDVVGIAIATRADSITKDTLNYLEELNKKTFLTIELGLQTINPKTSSYLNRQETLSEFEHMVYELHQRNIFTVIHIINGLPGESKDDMLKTVQYLNKLPIDGIKIHMLCVLKNTKLGRDYLIKPFPILTKEEYVDILCDQLEILRPEIVIERISADPNPNDLIEPQWVIKKFDVMNTLDKEMKKRNIYQGDKKDS